MRTKSLAKLQQGLTFEQPDELLKPTAATIRTHTWIGPNAQLTSYVPMQRLKFASYEFAS